MGAGTGDRGLETCVRGIEDYLRWRAEGTSRVWQEGPVDLDLTLDPAKLSGLTRGQLGVLGESRGPKLVDFLSDLMHRVQEKARIRSGPEPRVVISTPDPGVVDFWHEGSFSPPTAPRQLTEVRLLGEPDFNSLAVRAQAMGAEALVSRTDNPPGTLFRLRF